eukprot:Em0022g928a
MKSAMVVVVMIVLSMADARPAAPKAMGITKIGAQKELKLKWASPDQTNMGSTYEAMLEDMMLRYLREKMSKDKLNEQQAEEVNVDGMKRLHYPYMQTICCSD